MTEPTLKHSLALLRSKRRDSHPAGIRTYPARLPGAGFLTTTGLVLYQPLHLLPR